MKKFELYIAAGCLAVVAAACSEERFDVGGEGSLVLNTTLNSDLKVESRATQEELGASAMIWISNDKGLVRRYNGIENVPTQIDLVAGHYIAEGWTGDSVPASFESRWFKGRQEFDVEAGATATVDLVCGIANVAASVRYAESLDDVLTDYTMTVGHARGSLIFDGRDTRRGYFMMPSTDHNLSYELRGTQLNGQEFVLNGVIENAQPATEYVLNVLYTAQTTDVGGAVFSIRVDQTEIEVASEIQIVAAPKITGYDFDINKSITAEAGLIGRRSVYIASATQITSVEMRSSLFNDIAVIGGEDLDLTTMNAAGVEALNAAGINFSSSFNAEADESLFQINFEEAFTNSLTDGLYTVDIIATDKLGNVSNATVTFNVTSVPVIAEAATLADISATGATLRATISKADVASAGFEYRKQGTADWTYVDAAAARSTFNNGDVITVALTGLEPGTTYEYRVVAGDYQGSIMLFTTDTMQQLPNAGFEEWSKVGKANVAGLDHATSFWDSGDHGSAGFGYSICMPSSDVKHSGNYSARLESQKAVVKFAAGNIFAGNYLKTAGTNGVLGWGREFTSRPKSVKLWVQYTPQAAKSGMGNGAGTHIKAGEMDKGIVYFALVDGTTTPYSGSDFSFADHPWPCVVKTATGEVFDKNGANVIAYAERVFDGATGGMIEVDIPFDYKKTDARPVYIIAVASSSIYGDYFEGGVGSEMYLDDIEMVY